MALKDKIELGISLPHRSPEPIDMGELRRVAQRAAAQLANVDRLGRAVRQ